MRPHSPVKPELCCEHVHSWRSETHGPRNPVSSFLRHVCPCVRRLIMLKSGTEDKGETGNLSLFLWGPPRPAVGLRQRVCRVVKNPAQAGATEDTGSISGLGRSPGGGNDNPLQYSCLKNPMDRGAWRATIHGVTESRHD